MLEALTNGNGSWTATIASECAASPRHEGLGDLAHVSEFLGSPLVPTGSERIDTGTYRRQLAKPDDKPTDHLGEAETLAIVLSRSLNAAFVTDDLEASKLFQREGITTYRTVDRVRLAVRAKLLSVSEAWGCVDVLRGHGRASGPQVQDSREFARWCRT